MVEKRSLSGEERLFRRSRVASGASERRDNGGLLENLERGKDEKMANAYPMAFVTAPGRIEYRDRKLRGLQSNEVLVKVKAASICGGDLHIFKGKHPAALLPVPIGHEVAGEVVKVGRNVSKVREGDRVVIEPVIVCGKCYFCRRGEYGLCTNISFQYRAGQGGVTPFFIADEDWIHQLPRNVSFDEGALIEPLAVAVHAVRRGEIHFGQTAAIFGAGPIGLLVLMLTKLAGAGEIFVVDVKDFRLEKAAQLGASDAINSSRRDSVQHVLKRTGQLGVDRAFEAVGIEKTLVESLKVLKKGGTSVVVGLFEEQDIRIPANIFVQKEITLRGSQGYCWDFQTALKLVEGGTLKLEEIITHTLPVSELQKAFELLMDPNSKAIKVVIRMD
jgi:2-desacetyl-2-hydroxyethyl bacteriochlorophyllide A dehydrogenase